MKKQNVITGVLIVLIILIVYVLLRGKSETIDSPKYFDANGTTPMCAASKKAYNAAINCGNASSSYYKGKYLQKARMQILQRASQNKKYKVIFNSGASEGNNFIIRCVAEYYNMKSQEPHIVISALEHHTSLECIKQLGISATQVLPNSEGIIDPMELIQCIRPNTKLVSIMHWNNETGSKNNLAELVNAVKIYCKKQNQKIWFHSDVVQSFGKLETTLPDVDAFTMSFHKVYGPMGLGAMVISEEFAKLCQEVPQIAGTQQYGLRGGTENLPAISAGTAALQCTWKNRAQKNQHLLQLKTHLISELLKQLELDDFSRYYKQHDTWTPVGNPKKIRLVILGPTHLGLPDSRAAPNTLLMSFIKPGVPLQKRICNLKIRKALQDSDFKISIGSACQSKNTEPSHVLQALQAPFIIRSSVIRISFMDKHKKCHVDKLACCILKNLHEQSEQSE